MSPRHFRFLAALAASVYLAVLLIWPALWVPNRFGLVLHGLLALPGLIALPGLWRGKLYTHAWGTMCATLYTAYAAWQAYGELAVRVPALVCLSAGMLWFVGSNLYVRGMRRR